MASLSEGMRIGPYRIVRKLGEGGMGEVFEAVHETLGRHAAIKILHPDYTRNADIVRRFFNEARAVNLIDHPGIVQTHDFGQMADGTAYLVMEYLRGESLSGRLRRLGGALQPADVVRLGYLIADGLAAVHAQGIVHRDLKPDNLMIVSDPNVTGGERIKILDFGIAKLGESTGIDKTRSAALMGTPRYMSPEQCRGAGGVDDRTDVYALGVMLYLLLSGRPPFDGEGAGDIMGKHMYEQPPPLHDLAPHVPPPLSALVDGLLRKNRQERPAMREVADALLQMQQGPGLAAVAAQHGWITPGAGLLQQDRPSLHSLASGQITGHGGPRRRAGIAIGATVVVLAGAFAGVRLRHAPDRREPVTAAAPRLINWQVDSKPAGAEVVRAADGQVLGRTPWRHQQPAAPGTLLVRLHLPGHAEQEISLTQDADVTRKQTIPPLPAAAQAPPTAPQGHRPGGTTRKGVPKAAASRPHAQPKKEIPRGPQIED